MALAKLHGLAKAIFYSNLIPLGAMQKKLCVSAPLRDSKNTTYIFISFFLPLKSIKLPTIKVTK